MFATLKTRRPSPAMGVAIAAVVLASSGTSYAATAALSGSAIKKRSVPANRIVNESLTTTQINELKLGEVPSATKARTADTAGTATSAKTADAATVAKTADSATSAKTADSATTAKTADAATTAKSADTASDAAALGGNPASAFAPAGVRVVTEQTGIVDPGGASGTSASVSASCLPTERAISGGGGWFVVDTETASTLHSPIHSSYPLIAAGEPTGWRIVGRNMTGNNRQLRVHVLCAPKSVG